MDKLSTPVTDRRKETRSRVFHYIYDAASPCSKQDIARDLNISLPTLYQNLNELLEAGYIEYCGSRASSGGRPAAELHVVNSIRVAIGISITANHLRFAATNLSKQIIAYKSLRHSLSVETPEFGEFVAKSLEQFIDEFSLDRERLLGVGIILAGIILPDSNTVFYAPTLYLRNLSLQSLVKAIPYPVYTENDASSGGFAEWFHSRSQENMVFLSLAEGVGGAVLVNGDQYSGSNFRSGEFGHMCVEWSGRKCACGKKGCLEAYCSSNRIVMDSGMRVEDFFQKLRDGNETVIPIWEDYKKHLVVGIHNIRMALDCDIILGGFMTEYIEPYLPELKALLAEADPFEEDCDYLWLSESPKYYSIVGSALKFIRSFLDSI